MSYLSFIIALLQLLNQGGTQGLTLYQGLDIYLDLVVGVERFFLNLSLGFMIIVLIVGAVIAVLSSGSWRESVSGLGCGCYLLILAFIWPVLEFITFWIATGLADSVTAAGIIDPTKFWLLVILMALIGVG